MVNKLTRGIALGFFLIGLMVGSVTISGAGITTLNLNPQRFWNKEEVDPVAGFTFTPDGNCANVPVKFTNTSIGDGLTYEWDFKDGTKSTDKDPTHTFSSAIGNGTKTFTVILKVTDKDNDTNSVTQTVTVKEIPSLNVTSDREGTDFENLKSLLFVKIRLLSSSFLMRPEQLRKTHFIKLTGAMEVLLLAEQIGLN